MANTKPRIQLTDPVRMASPLGAALGRVPQRVGKIRQTDRQLTWANRLDHFLARWGYRRSEHRVEPGLYALGQPDADSPVLVTANYTLSFDALRSALEGRNAYLLVLDTKGINVWCAAGKGTFGTEELVRRVHATGLAQVVDHRKLILPQLGAAGVSAHQVRKLSGFRVEYGPVRAADLAQYLDTGNATPAMRQVTFRFWERLVLIPVELMHTVLPMLGAAVVLYFLAGPWAAIGAMAAVLAGAALFPLLLPWLPTRDFSTKGFVLGGLVALLITLGGWSSMAGATWQRALTAAAYLVGFPAVTAYLALNFTGSTPVASKSGVKREMSRYIPVMAAMAGVGVVAILVAGISRWIGG